MDYDTVIEKWGRRLLEEQGEKVSPETPVRVDLNYSVSGGCETCEYTEGVINIRAGKLYVEITSYNFQEALRELVKIAAEEKS